MLSFPRVVIAGASVAALALASLPALAQPCGGQGNATLLVTSPDAPTPGRRLTIELTGSPNRPFAIAADVGPGPRVRPNVGTICLDLSPRLVVLFNGFPSGSPALGGDGKFAFNLSLPPRAALGGNVFYMQAFVRDATAPNGLAITPRLDLTVDRAVVETFSTIASRDQGATTADWLGDGTVRGLFTPERTVDVEPPDSGFLLPQPLTTTGNRIQLLYTRDQLGMTSGESILGLSWGPRSNFLFASTYSGVEMLLGHTNVFNDDLTFLFDVNFDGPPTRLFSGDYAVPNAFNTPWFPWPRFSSDFEYDGTRSLLVDVNVPTGAATFQLFRSTSNAVFPRSRIFAGPSASSATAGDRTTYHARFAVSRIRAVAQSTFYDTGLDDPVYGVPAVRATAPDGTEVAIEVEGAEDSDRNGQPDPGTLTGFRADPSGIAGSRLVRFRLSLRANPSLGTVPSVTSVSIPFR